VNIIITAFLLVVIAKLFHIQILDHDIYQHQAERQSTNVNILPAVRGNIEDRDGNALTTNIMHYSFAVDPKVVGELDALISQFARVFHRSESYYRKRFTPERSFVWLERNVPFNRCEELLNLQSRGLIVQRESRRRYPYGHLVAPLIGYTDVDGKGISGLELEYDTFLRGEDGWQVLRRDAKGRVSPLSRLKRETTRDGARVTLTINIDLQSILQEEMALAYQQLTPNAIHGILMDPNTGEILALAQYPSFDPSQIDADQTAHHRIMAITDMYEPGSTLKVVTATAALEEGLFSPLDEFDTEDGEFAYHNLLIKDTYPQDILTFADIIAYSSNIGIIKLAENLGASTLYRYCCRFGLGTRTGITFPGESPGLLREQPDWSAISTGEIAMGQEIGVTTLQLALVYSAIANGGQLIRPWIVSQVVDGRDKRLMSGRPEIIRRVASPAAMEQLRRILHHAVEQGTGSEARLPGFSVAGKTGTAQKFLDGKYSNKEFVATFAAMFPAEQPRLVCVVAVDGPRYGRHFGGEAAAPIVQNTLKRIVNFNGDAFVPPLSPAMATASVKPSHYLLASSGHISRRTDPGVMPDFRDYSLRKALQLARRTGVQIQVTGSGRVTAQSIKPGTLLDPEKACLITLAPERISR
jgi:cell division protein FtsI (penicillin-binding protein 3)